MTKNEQIQTIDSNDLAQATGGWNPFKGVTDKFNEVKQKTGQVIDYGVDYVKKHPEILIAASRL